jgi:hypothetical protein
MTQKAIENSRQDLAPTNPALTINTAAAGSPSSDEAPTIEKYRADLSGGFIRNVSTERR